MAKAGLRKVTKTVRGKKGTVRRSYWVKAQSGGASRKQGLFNPGSAAFKRNSGLASANTGARVGLMTGLLGVHRLPNELQGGVGAAAQFTSQMLAHHQRRQYGARGKSIFGKIGHGIATEAGRIGGTIAGAALHEGARAIVRRVRRRG